MEAPVSKFTVLTVLFIQFKSQFPLVIRSAELLNLAGFSKYGTKLEN